MAIGESLGIVLGLSFLFYGSVTVVLLVGLKKVVSSQGREQPFVSVIVAARNEERNIPRLLESLLAQSYSSYQIILVDDDSSDNTLGIAKQYASRDARLTVISANSDKTVRARKKAALTTGIEAGEGELLLFTDADCLPGSDWIRSMTGRFTDDVGLVAGYSPYNDSLLSPETRPTGILGTLFRRFIRYEELKGAIWSAGSIGVAKGWLCTGRNLAYRRSVWNEVGGFSSLMDSVSGDDDLFLQLVRRSTRWKISYSFDPRSFVQTAPPESFQMFVMQRKRHFSAGKYFTFPMKLFFLTFHASNLLLFLGLIFGVFLAPVMLFSSVFFLGKLVLDLLLVTTGASLLSEDRVWPRVVLMELLYLSYTSLIGPLGFVGTFEWKPNLKS